jgi:hypothetical protein
MDQALVSPFFNAVDIELATVSRWVYMFFGIRLIPAVPERWFDM